METGNDGRKGHAAGSLHVVIEAWDLWPPFVE
jgi:hypothetical protein